MARLPRFFWDPMIVMFAAAVGARWICGHWWLDLTPSSLILIACVAALLPVFASTLAMQLLRRGANTDIREAGQRFALRMAWLGPLTIWLTYGSVLAAPCAAFFTMLLAAAAWRYYGAVDPRWTIASTHYSLSLAMCASLFIQAAVFTGIAGWISTASVLAALAAICITARRFQSTDPWAATKPRWFNAFASVLAAFICAALGLLQHLEFGAGGSANAGGRARQTPAQRYDDDNSPSIGGDYRGVILWPEETKHTTLIPPLPQLHRTFGIGSENPLSIPFFGAYWIFKSPDRRPAPRSYETKGTLLDRTFRSPDYYPLQFEAHQNLGSSIDLACCKAIAIEVRNKDRDPLTISLQLNLIDATGPFPMNQNLGLQTISSTPTTDGVISERLTYPIPAAHVISRFDGFHIRFHLKGIRRNVSPKVAIDRFLLIPRGY